MNKSQQQEAASAIVLSVCLIGGDGFGGTGYTMNNPPSLTDSDFGWALIRAVFSACSPLTLDLLVKEFRSIYPE